MAGGFFDRLRAERSILKRTKAGGDLPKLALYLEWLGGTSQRRLLDTEGKQHDVDDDTVESHYKLVSGGKVKALMKEHWPDRIKDKSQPATAAK